jgi:hypothetical protein
VQGYMFSLYLGRTGFVRRNCVLNLAAARCEIPIIGKNVFTLTESTYNIFGSTIYETSLIVLVPCKEKYDEPAQIIFSGS